MHENGYVHRDLKPNNILLDLTVNPMRVKLADFGFSKLIQEVNSVGKLKINKKASCKTYAMPLYKPPESKFVYDFYTDLFIMGLILFDMIYLMKKRTITHE